MHVEEFRMLIEPITGLIGSHDVDESLGAALAERFPAGGSMFETIEKACHAGIADGWMCFEGGRGRRFGRVVEPTPDTGNLSVDVVDLENVTGPHHRHPLGEICMVMPVDGTARFDGVSRGWCVYGPGSAHRPTVTGGRALVLYLLPQGRIEFTGE